MLYIFVVVAPLLLLRLRLSLDSRRRLDVGDDLFSFLLIQRYIEHLNTRSVRSKRAPAIDKPLSFGTWGLLAGPGRSSLIYLCVLISLRLPYC